MSKFVGNPTDQDLFCAAAREVIPARGELEVSDEVAAQVPDHVFTVSDAPAEPAAAEPEASTLEAEVAALEEAAKKIEDEAASPAEGASA